MPLGRLLKPKEAAQALGISIKTLKRWRQDKHIPYTEVAPEVNRYPEKVLGKWVRERTQKPLI